MSDETKYIDIPINSTFNTTEGNWIHFDRKPSPQLRLDSFLFRAFDFDSDYSYELESYIWKDGRVFVALWKRRYDKNGETVLEDIPIYVSPTLLKEAPANTTEAQRLKESFLVLDETSSQEVSKLKSEVEKLSKRDYSTSEREYAELEKEVESKDEIINTMAEGLSKMKEEVETLKKEREVTNATFAICGKRMNEYKDRIDRAIPYIEAHDCCFDTIYRILRGEE